MLKNIIRRCASVLIGIALLLSMTGLSACTSATRGKRIVRIALGQSETHPQYIGLVAFKDYIEANLGDKYEVQIFPNELLGSTQKAIELTQTGAIDFVVAGTANLETFADVYEVFSMPYLFDSVDSYLATMQDTDYMQNVYKSTDAAGFRVLTWYSAGTRNFYGKKPINTPADLKGMKIRVQQSPASVKMMKAFGAAASPMSFGEVYTAIQQGVIDGAENNELALTNNKHGEVAKYYTYNMHQMIPDMLVGNLKFLQGLSEEELAVFQAAAAISTEVELLEWDKGVQQAKEIAANEMGVTFIYPDIEPFTESVLPMQQEMLENNPDIVAVYNHIQEVNDRIKAEQGQGEEKGTELKIDDTQINESEINQVPGADIDLNKLENETGNQSNIDQQPTDKSAIEQLNNEPTQNEPTQVNQGKGAQ